MSKDKFTMTSYKEVVRDGTTEEFKLFNYQDLGDIRTFIDDEERTWICLDDICKILNLGSPKSISTKIDKAWVSSVVIENHTKDEKLTFVYEAGVGTILFFSKKARIINFRRWLFREALEALVKEKKKRIEMLENLKAENERLKEKLLSKE